MTPVVILNVFHSVVIPFNCIPEVPVGEIKVRTLTAGLFSEQRCTLGTSEGKISADNKSRDLEKVGDERERRLMLDTGPFIGPFFQSGCRFAGK